MYHIGPEKVLNTYTCSESFLDRKCVRYFVPSLFFLMLGGASDLKKVREETAKRRQQIAEEYHKLPVDTRDK